MLCDRQIRLIIESDSNGALVQFTICLRPGRPDRWPLARIQCSKLDAGAVDSCRHRAAQRIDLLRQVALADATDRRVAAHRTNCRDLLRNQKCARTRSRGSQTGFRTGMAAANYDDIEKLGHWSKSEQQGSRILVAAGLHRHKPARFMPMQNDHSLLYLATPSRQDGSASESHGLSMIQKSALPLLLLLMSAAAAAAPDLELSDCRISAGPGHPGIKARCGSLLRPLNPHDPASEELELRVAVVAALDLEPEPDAVVPLAGGPGGSAIQFYSAFYRAFEPARRDRDILLLDQRGTGSSARMDCPFDDDIVAGLYTDEQTLEFTRSCLEQLPHDPRFFTTSVAVTDLEAVRAALGYSSLNLVGTSYGTRVAQHFARRYPESTRTIILDGVVPPQVPLGPEIATEAQRALDNIFARCAEDADCNAHFPEVDLDFESLRARIDEAPVTVALSDPVTGHRESVLFGHNELAAAIRLLAYSPRTIAIIPLLVHEAANDNFVPLAAQFQLTVSSLADALALGMHNSVVCAEDLPFVDRQQIDFAALDASYIGALQLEALETICSIWPRGPVDDGFVEPLATDIPVLLLSGSADPITPPRYAELAAVELANAVHLVGEQQGHGQLAAGCTPKLIAQFISTAEPAGLDPGCMERAFVMPFFLDFSGPSP